MAIRRWDPFRDLLAIQNEMNRLFGRTFAPGSNREEPGSVDGTGVTEAASEQGTWVPPIDVAETPERYVITVELAGLTTGDVDIVVEENVLTLRGKRPFYTGVAEDAFHRIERRFGPFHRRVALPQGVDTSSIEAAMADGLLTIEVGKATQVQPRRVEVKAASAPRE